MKFRRVAGMLFMVFSVGSASITQEPCWMFANGVPLLFAYFRYCDTARDANVVCTQYPPDTGDSYDSSEYINFDYQFSADSVIVKDPYDSNNILYRDAPRPGYAGFKTAWDYGMTGFLLARYKYLVLAHKGPLSTHKVTVKFWYNNGQCGAPSYNVFLGTFAASSAWKVDTIPIPDSLQNKPDNFRNKMNFFEMVAIINNLDPNDTTSGPPGSLKIDNIRLVGCNPIDTSPKSQKIVKGESVTLKVWTSRADTADILTYQWKKDGVDITGADSSFYTVSSAQALVPPTITTQPASQTVNVDQSVTFTVGAKTADSGVYTVAVTVSSTNLSFTSQGGTLTVTDTSPLSYQWSKDGVPLTGDTRATKTITSVQATDAGAYTVVVSNSTGNVTSATATLTVDAKEDKGCGCGAGTGTALIPPLFFKAMAHRKRKKKNLKV